MRSDLPAGLPLLGLSKDRPSIVHNRRVRRPGFLPSGMDCQSLPRAVHVVSHHLDGFTSPTAQVCFALLPIMGFAVFLPVAKRTSSQRIPALRSVPPADSDGSGTRPCPWARVTARLASSPFSPGTVQVVSHRASATIARGGAWSGGLEALLHRRVRCFRRHFAGCGGPILPWAWPIPGSLRHLAFSPPRGADGAARARAFGTSMNVKDRSEKRPLGSNPQIGRAHV